MQQNGIQQGTWVVITSPYRLLQNGKVFGGLKLL